jgi:hypothetical protein
MREGIYSKHATNYELNYLYMSVCFYQFKIIEASHFKAHPNDVANLLYVCGCSIYYLFLNQF